MLMSPETNSDSPGACGSSFSARETLGRRMSASISRVFFTWAKAKARLQATVVLPSPGMVEVTRTVLWGESSVESCTSLRMVRMPSENVFELSSTTARSSGASGVDFILGSTPTALTSSRASRSRPVLMPLSSKVRKRAIATPANSAPNIASITILRRSGPEGPPGIRARSTMRAIGCCTSPMRTSFAFWMKAS